MSNSIHSALSTALSTHYSGIVLDQENLYGNGGTIEADFNWLTEGAQEGTDDLCIRFSAHSKGFTYTDENTDIDGAVVDFEVSVFGAKKKETPENFGWDWTGSKKFVINTDPDRVNVFVSKDGKALIEPKLSDSIDDHEMWDLAPTLSKSDDELINEHVCRAVSDNSSTEQIIIAVTDLLDNLSHNFQNSKLP